MKRSNISNDMMLIIMSFVFTFSVGSLAMGFFPAVKVGEMEEVMYGLDCMTKISTPITLLLIFTYLLPIVSFIFAFLAAKRKHHKIMFFVSSALSFLSAILIILEPVFIGSVITDEITYAFGPIIGFLFAVVQTIITLMTGIIRN